MKETKQIEKLCKNLGIHLSLETLKESRKLIDELISIYDVETVASLRRKGYKVRVYHSRDTEPIFDPRGGWTSVKKAKGGHTEVNLISPQGIRATGEALCSLKDNYCKKTGVRIALKRALENLKEEENVFEEVASEIREKNIRRGLDSLREAQELYKKQIENIKIEKQVLEF